MRAVRAIVGAVPLLLGVLVRTSLVRGWAAEKTSALLARELGVTARYKVEVEAWPMMIALSNVEVDASDGGIPFPARGARRGPTKAVLAPGR